MHDDDRIRRAMEGEAQAIEALLASQQDRVHRLAARMLGNVALHLAPWTMTGTLPDGTPVSQTGLSVAVMRRQPDGAWRMVIDHPYGDHLSRAS